MNLQDTWKKVLNRLKKELPDTTYTMWFEKTIQPILVEGNKLLLLVPTNSHKEQIKKKHYYNMLRSAIKLYFGRTIEPNFLIGEIDTSKNEYENKKDLSSSTKYKDNVVDDEVYDEEFNDNSNNTEHKEAYTNGVDNYSRNHNLNPKYIFDEFVIGKNNEFAYAAAVSVAKTKGNSYNPLFLYSNVGLGKTHLMQSIANYILERNKDAKIAYVTSENFTNEFINAIRDAKNEEFRQKYRTVDVLLVDDVQFFVKKKETQEEFFHTFTALYESNKTIVLSSDRHPREINQLENRLKSRFEQGLVADMFAPDYETRKAILRKKIASENVVLPDDVLEYIAENIKSNIRELEGALTRVVAYSHVMNTPIDLNMAIKYLENIIAIDKPNIIDIKTIKKIVASYYNIDEIEFNTQKRSRNIVYPRQIAMYLARELTGLSLAAVGKNFGGRDHSTVIHAYDKIANDIASDDEFKNKINNIIQDIKNI